MSTTQTEQGFLQELETAFAQSNLDFARAYYLFATAKLSEQYNSREIYERYPILTEESTFLRLKTLYDQNPDDEETKRMFTNVLGSYIGNMVCEQSDEIQNLKNHLKIDVRGLGLKDKEGRELEEVLYEDVPEHLKKVASKKTRQELYNRMGEAHGRVIAPKWIALFHRENQLLTDLGYPDLIEFYSKTSGHALPKLGETGKKLVEETESLYLPRISALYQSRVGEDFSTATRSDIAYVFHGHSKEMEEIDKQFPSERLVSLAVDTFDGMGLDFSNVAQSVDYKTMEDYNRDVVDRPATVNGNASRRILLDIATREGKRSRAYVYPAQVPSEIYLSVKPEGGLDDYSAFFHESGHALHFAYESPSLSFAMAQMGNNTVTECYAYLFQNLFLNAHWLREKAGLSATQAVQSVQRRALDDLYMLRRYSAKMRFELELFKGSGPADEDLDRLANVYADMLTKGTGFKYDAEGWSRDVDAGFYVADYFTAWTLEAQLREYLCRHFGKPEALGEDWYATPKAGEFLKALWKDGNLTPQDLSARLDYNNPNDVGPLLRLMRQNLERSA